MANILITITNESIADLLLPLKILIFQSGTHERIGVFKISANIGSHFEISHKNIDKNIKCLKY